MSVGNRGKYAEGQVRRVLATINSADFAFARWPDAHAGSRTPAPADFIICSQGQTILLEVKECQHTHRLPYPNFHMEQMARMRLWQLAGAKAYTLVYFAKSEQWFMAGLEWWYNNRITGKDGKVVGSWDTSDLPKFGKKELPSLIKNYI